MGYLLTQLKWSSLFHQRVAISTYAQLSIFNRTVSNQRRKITKMSDSHNSSSCCCPSVVVIKKSNEKPTEIIRSENITQYETK